MASITTRQTAGTGATVKGSPLTNTELDNNFINLNSQIVNGLDNPTWEGNLDFGAEVANTWKKIIGVSLVNQTYSTIGFKIEVIDPNANHAVQTSIDPDIETYYVACIRAEATTLNTPDLCVVRGPGNRIRAVKTAVGVYEVQMQNEGQYREYYVKIIPYVSNNQHTIQYFKLGTIGSATATYTASVGNSTLFTEKLQAQNTITSTVATGTAPFVISSTTRVSNLNVATAGTADTLTTARAINGVNFNGSAAISIPDLQGTNGTTTLATTGVTSGVNYLTATNSITGAAVGISTAGSDTNIGLNITTKGTGAITLDTGTGAGQIDLKPGSSNVRIWDDNSSNYYQFVTGDRTANYDITLPAGNVTLTAGTTVVTDATNQTIAGTKTFSGTITSTVATGTAPLSIASTTVVTNLNADLLDGVNSTSFLRSDEEDSLVINNTSTNTSNNGLLLDYNLSGTTALTADRTKYGLYVDLDHSSTAGNTTVGQRETIYATRSSADSSGTPYTLVGSYNSTRTTNATGTVNSQWGVFALAEADCSTGGAVTAAYGGQFQSQDGGTGTVGTLYGSLSYVLKETAATGTLTNAIGARNEVEIDGNIITTAYGTQSIIDIDGGAIQNAYLTYAAYEGTIQQVYTALAPTGGTGSNALFNVTVTSSNTYSCSINNAGTGYTANDTLTIVGTTFNGVAVTNDITLTVLTVGASGEILTFSSSGTAKQWAWNAYYASNIPSYFLGEVRIGSTTSTGTEKLQITGDAHVTGTLNVRTAIDLADNDILRLGSGDDWEMYHNGTDNYIDLTVGNLLIRDDGTAGDPTRFTFTRTTGNLSLTSLNTTSNITASTSTGTVSIGVDAGGSISLGRTDNTASTPYIDFNSGSTTVDYDTRIVASSGTGSSGEGTLTLTAQTLNLSTNATASGATKTIVVGGSGLSGSTTQILSGSSVTGSASTHIWYSGGTEAMRLNSTGLAVGISSPNVKLDVLGRLRVGSDASGADFGTGTVIWNTAGGNGGYAAYQHIFYSGNNDSRTERMRITSTGNVGIGNTTPGTKLVVGNGSEALGIWANGINSGSGGGANVQVQLNGTPCIAIANKSGILGGTYDATPTLYFNGGLVFHEAGTERMRITSGGNVGIGATTTGTTGLTLAQNFNLAWDQGLTESIPNIFRQASSAALVMGYGVKFSSTANQVLSSYGSNLGKSAISVESLVIKFFVNSESTMAVGSTVTLSERMRITSTGNVGIGTTNPSAMLDVNGGARIQGLTVGRGGGAVAGNTAIGVEALQVNTSGDYNTALGLDALRLNTTGNYNTAVGEAALYEITTNSHNTAVGRFSLTTTTGSNNTAIGSGAGYGTGANANTTGSNNTFIGYQAVGASSTASNVITLGNSSIGVLRCQVTTITALSDARDKTNIVDIPAGLFFVQKLRPVAFDWNMRDGKKVGITEFGFIAQELLTAQENTGITVPNLVSTENPEKLEAAPGTLIPILVKAIQEQQQLIEALTKRIEKLEKPKS